MARGSRDRQDWLTSSALAELGQYLEAPDVTEANLRQNPNSQPAIEGLGYIYLKSGKFDEAIPIYKRAIEVHADADYLYAQLGTAYLGAGDLDSASEQQRVLLNLNPLWAEELQKEIQEKANGKS